MKERTILRTVRTVIADDAFNRNWNPSRDSFAE